MIVLDPPELCGDFSGMIEGLDDLGIWLPLGSEAGLTDLSGNGYNGTAQGGVTVGAGAGLIPNDTDTSTDFDGSNDYISTTYTTRQNLVAYPSSETDDPARGFTTSGAVVADGDKSTEWAKYGGYSAQFHATGLGAGGYVICYPNGTPGGAVGALVANNDYLLARVSVKIETIPTGGLIRAELLVSNGAGGFVVLDSEPVPSVGEYEFVFLAQNTAGAAYTRVAIRIVSNVAHSGGDFKGYVDARLIEKVSGLGIDTGNYRYFDGSGYVNDSGVWVDDPGGHVGWLGTAHASASDKGAFANGTVRGMGAPLRVDSLAAARGLIGSATNGLWVNTDGSLNLRIAGTDVTGNAGDLTAASTAFVWAEFDEPNNTVRFYVNGVLVDTVTGVTAQWAAETLDVGRARGIYQDGLMQHVAVVEGALSPAKIAELARAALNGSERKPLTIGGAAGSAIRVTKNGIDWGDAGIEAFLADRQLGAQPLGFRVPNRVIMVPLVISAASGTSFETARRQLQAKVARIRNEQRGWLKRERASGDLYCDLVGATLSMPDSWFAENREVEPEATLILEAIPDFYGEEGESALYTAATNGEVSFTITDPSGDLPGRVRIELEELGNDEIRSLFWAVRSKQIGEATALMAYEAEALTPMGGAIATQSGATGGASNNVVSKTALSTTFRPILSTEIDGVGPMTHIGLHRVLARVYNPNLAGIDLALRLESFSGDPTRPEYGPIVSDLPPVDWQIVGLGTINPSRAKVGDQGWEGRILAKSADLGGVKIDRVWVLPVEEGEGQIVASSTLPSPESDTLWDNFDQTAGNLTGKALPSTGAPVWTVVASSDAADFTIDTAAHTATRSVVSDVAWTGRYLSAGTAAHAGVRVAADLNLYNASGITDGIFLRLVDINNWLMLRVNVATKQIELLKRVGGGTPLSLFAGDSPLAITLFGRLSPLRLTAEALTDGTWKAALTNPGVEPTDFEHVGSDAVLATGGALDDGKVGVYDEYTGATAGLDRIFDNFSVADLPAGDAVLYPLAAAELRSDGYVREAPSGIYSEIPPYSGDLPRQPATGLEERDAEWLISISRGNLAEKPDTDRPGGSFSARVAHRPSWLVVPGD